MKNINVVFEDEEYQRLRNEKHDDTWREFILQLAD